MLIPFAPLAAALLMAALPAPAAWSQQQAPPAPANAPRLVDVPRLAPAPFNDARHNHMREVEEAQRKAAEEADPQEPPPEAGPPPAPQPAPDAAPQATAQAGGLRMAPPAVAGPGPAAGVAPAPPVPANAAMSPKIEQALKLLGALAMLLGPLVGAMWLMQHPVPPQAE